MAVIQVGSSMETHVATEWVVEWSAIWLVIEGGGSTVRIGMVVRKRRRRRHIVHATGHIDLPSRAEDRRGRTGGAGTDDDGKGCDNDGRVGNKEDKLGRLL